MADEYSFFERCAVQLSDFSSTLFSKWGKFVATSPLKVILTCVAFMLALSSGLYRLSVDNDPESIWVPPTSQTALQQDAFNAVFSPFYRIEQVIFTKKPEAVAQDNDTNVLLPTYLRDIFPVQLAINNTKAKDGSQLSDYCFEPMKGEGCMIQTPLDYWRSDPGLLQNLTVEAMYSAMDCDGTLNNKVECVSDIGVPVMMDVVLGGLGCAVSNSSSYFCPGDPCNHTAEALIITYLLNDLDNMADAAAAWEKDVFLNIVSNFKHPVLQATYMAQRSVQDELGVVDTQNKDVVIYSYIAMFGYIVFALGRFPHPVKSRVALGLQGIIIVAGSAASAIGLVSWFGMSITMIVTEVVPFLVLAIGVDNMFIISKAWDRRCAANGEKTEAVAETAGHVLAEVGPSVSAAAVSECLAFAVGALTRIPALQQFCIVAGTAVLIDYFMQLSWFVAGLTLDSRRASANKVDVFCCITARQGCVPRNRFWDFVSRGEYVRTFLKNYYAPFLMKGPVRIIVLLSWAVMLVASIYSFGQLKLGLEQQLVLPQGSYLMPYFDQQATLGDAGPPVYIVLQNVNYTAPNVSLAIEKVVDAVSASELIVRPITNWFDQFKTWEMPNTTATIEKCLAEHTCPDCQIPLNVSAYPFAQRACFFLYAISLNSKCCQENGFCGAQYAPDVKFLWEYKPTGEFTAEEPAGLRAGPTAAQFCYSGDKLPVTVMHSRLRTQSTALRVQEDFVHTMQATQQLVSRFSVDLPQVDVSQFPISKGPAPSPEPSDPNNYMHYKWIDPAPGGKAYAYSLYYVYYDQYNYIRGVALQSILLALGAVFAAIVWISNPGVAVVVVLCVASVAIDLVGFIWMLNPPYDNDPSKTHLYGVDVNAVSVVNIITAVGLSVEFCVHIATSFVSRSGTRLERATAALVEMGSCVVTGITITKLVGVMVLNWAPSVLFRLYYFRMYAGIIACGAFHGLAFLPVLLSFVGPESAVKRVEYFDLMDPLLSKNADPMDYSSLNGDKSSGEKIVSGITQPLLAEDDRIR